MGEHPAAKPPGEGEETRGKTGMRRLAALLPLVALALSLGVPAADARSYRVAEAEVTVVVEPDGSVVVREDLTFSFDGDFRGAFREIPLRPGEAISAVTVSEGDTAYVPGAPTELGSLGDPGSFGVEDLGSRLRVVWHYRASDEERTFTVAYRMTGLAVAYDDVVDVNLKVWGDEWDVFVGRVQADMVLPGSPQPGEVLVWGHPAAVRGFTTLGEDGVSPSLIAGAVPPRQFVELRVVFPRRLLDTADGAAVVPRSGLEEILAEEAAQEARDQRAAERAANAERVRNVTLGTLLAFLLPIPIGVTWAFRRYGSEPRVAYDREYEQAPPSEHPPAIVGALVSQGAADEAEFTSTMFDLIRRGVFTARPVTVEQTTRRRRRREQISDLEIGLGDDEKSLKSYERTVVTIVKRVLSDGPQPLTSFRRRIRDDAEANSKSYYSFRHQVRRALVAAKLLDTSGRITGPASLIGIFLLVGAVGWVVVAPLLDRAFLLVDQEILRPGILVVTFFAVIVVSLLAGRHALWVRRSKPGALLDARWKAFRRYLQHFSRLAEAPAISLPLWEEYLVYGIALGVAEDVLEAARMHAPPELESSSLYWYGSHGYGGHSSNAVSGIEKALTGAFRSPASASGGGGGFSGGGGGGRGGGGGGAW